MHRVCAKTFRRARKSSVIPSSNILSREMEKILKDKKIKSDLACSKFQVSFCCNYLVGGRYCIFFELPTATIIK